jgi:hypothetical protein
VDEEGDFYVTERQLIPKAFAIIAYHLHKGKHETDDIEWEERYYSVHEYSEAHFYKLVSGELIFPSSAAKKLVKRFNGKYYLRDEFSNYVYPPEQLLLFKK